MTFSGIVEIFENEFGRGIIVPLEVKDVLAYFLTKKAEHVAYIVLGNEFVHAYKVEKGYIIEGCAGFYNFYKIDLDIPKDDFIGRVQEHLFHVYVDPVPVQDRIECPHCKGEKQFMMEGGENDTQGYYVDCHVCEGEGTVFQQDVTYCVQCKNFAPFASPRVDPILFGCKSAHDGICSKQGRFICDSRCNDHCDDYKFNGKLLVS